MVKIRVGFAKHHHLLIANRFYLPNSRKERRQSRKNSSFEDSNGTIDPQDKTEESCGLNSTEEVEIDLSGAGDLNEVILVEEVVQEEEEQQQQHQQIFFAEEYEKEEEFLEDPVPMHSYPKATSPPRRRQKAKRGVDKMIQADILKIEERDDLTLAKKTLVIQLVDVGTQVCERDLTMVDAGC